MKSKKPWKKNFRRTPDWIQGKIAECHESCMVVSGIKRVKSSDIGQGYYSGIGLVDGPDGPVFPDLVVPLADSGRYSRRNVEGHEVVRKDLSKVPKTFSWEVPNWGDWSKGSHDCSFTRMVYVREFMGPREVQLKTELIGEELSEDKVFLFRFTVDEILDKTSPSFDADILSSINVLQENTGIADIYASSADVKDYLKTQAVEWEILPLGEDLLPRVLKLAKGNTDKAKQKIEERYQVFLSLGPKSLIMGTSGLRRYFGALVADDLVVFENVEYGNALYVMFDEWPQLSQLSRRDLLSSQHNGFERIIHKPGWQSQLKKLIDSRGPSGAKHAA